MYNNVKFYYDDKKNRKILEALSGISDFRLKKAIKSYESFNNLKLNEIIKLEDVIYKIGENTKL